MGAQGESKEGWPQRSRPPLARFVLVALFFLFYFALQFLFGVAGLVGEIHWGWLAGLVWGPRIAAESLVRARLDARER